MGTEIKTLRQLWEESKNLDSPVHQRSAYFSHIYFLSVTISVPLVAILKVLPSQSSDSSELEQYWFKVFIVFIALEALANWTCCQFYSSKLIGTRDRPTIEKTLWDSDEASTDITKNPNYCKICKLVAPHGSKTHHCKVCQVCILRRDHHCYMVGTCVGHRNQRYFAILCFYIAIGSITGFYYFQAELRHLAGLREDFSWTEYILPVTFKHFLTGRIAWVELLMVFYCYTFAWTTMLGTGRQSHIGLHGFGGTGFFFIQMGIIFCGLTFHEFKAQKKALQYRTISENFSEVFGPCWMLNFIMPMQLVFRPKDFEMPLILDENGYGSHNGVHENSRDISDLISVAVV